MHASVKTLEALILSLFFLFLKRRQLSTDMSDKIVKVHESVSQFNFYFTRINKLIQCN